jgi:hypothetical protein
MNPLFLLFSLPRTDKVQTAEQKVKRVEEILAKDGS